MAQGREVEVKFAVRDGSDVGLMAHPLFAAAEAPPVTARTNATYFDTPDGKLWRSGISLRVREADGHRTQTLKRAGTSAVERGEWEADAEADAPSLDWIGGTPLAHAFRHNVGRDLGPRFTVEVERTTLTLVHGSSAIEAAVDRGSVRAGARSAPVHEVELELKRGEMADLFALARALVADVALVPSLVSKAERGHRLLGDAGVASAALSPGMPAGAAAANVLEACLREVLLAAEEFDPASDEAEPVHRCRVALRRLRAAMALFKPVLADPGFEPLRGSLRWMSGLLGAARDRDVMQAEVFDPAAAGSTILGGHELAEHMRGRRRDARDALAAALASARWRTAVTDLVAWLSDGAWRRSEAAAGRLDDVLGPRLRKRRRRVARMGAVLDAGTPHERHRLRIEAKKVRYMLAFFEATRGFGKGSKHYRALQDGLGKLQDALGRLHDGEARRDLLRGEVFGWTGEANERATFAAGVLAAERVDEADLVAAASKAFRKVRRHARA